MASLGPLSGVEGWGAWAPARETRRAATKEAGGLLGAPSQKVSGTDTSPRSQEMRAVNLQGVSSLVGRPRKEGALGSVGARGGNAGVTSCLVTAAIDVAVCGESWRVRCLGLLDFFSHSLSAGGKVGLSLSSADATLPCSPRGTRREQLQAHRLQLGAASPGRYGAGGSSPSPAAMVLSTLGFCPVTHLPAWETQSGCVSPGVLKEPLGSSFHLRGAEV